MRLAVSASDIGRSLLAPPGVAAPRAALLRSAFDQMMKDPDFVAESARRGLDVEPLAADPIARIVADAMAMPADVVLCDLRMPGIDGFDLIPQIARQWPGVPILLMSAHGTEDLAIEAIQRGAYDYLAKPFQPSEIRLTLRKAAEREALRRQNLLLQRDMSRCSPLNDGDLSNVSSFI